MPNTFFLNAARSNTLGCCLSRLVFRDEVFVPALGSQQPHTTLQAWGRVAGKLPGGKGPEDVG